MATNRPKQTKNRLLIFARTYISAGAVLFWTISTFSFPVEAAINEKINYQGKLTDSNSIIVPDGAYDMVFALYTAPSGGSAIWTESWTSAALWSESSSTTVTRNAAPCGGSGFTSIVYSTGTNESSLAAGQYVWNTTLKESAAITSVDTGANTICVSNPYSSWTNGDDLTNRIYLKSGLFSTMLGSVTSLSSVNFSQTLYLGLTVGSDGEMAPRKVLGAVPSALTAKTLNNNESATLGTAAGATLNIGNTTGGITMNSGGTSAWTNTAGGLTIATATSGTLALNSAGALNISAVAASTVTLANVTDSLNFDSNTLSIDALNNRIGIGTNAPSAALELAASTASAASLQINSGTAPTAPNDGDVWYDGTHLYFHNNTTDRDLLAGGGYSNILDETTPLTQRSSLAFLGAGVTCQDNNGQTECTISAGGAGLWTDGTGISYLTDTAEDFAVGGSTLASPFSVDVSNSIVRIGLGSGSYNGTLAMYGSDGDTGNLSYTTNDAWDFEGGNVGIGTANPNSLLDVYSSSADSVLTLSAASATYNPLMKFRTGATPSVQFSMGVDTSDSNKFKIYSGDGIDGTSEFEMDTNGVTSIASLKLGAQSFAADAGAVSWIDMPVTSSASAGTVESYTAQLDGNAMLTIYGTSDGSGGTSNRSVRLSAPLGFLESSGSTYYTYFQGGDQSANITYTLPTAAPTADGQVLSSTMAGVMSWSSAMTNPMTTAGDLVYAGTGGAPTRLAGSTNNGYVLAYNTSTNVPYWTAMTGGGGTLQNAYDYTSGNTILTTTGRNIAFTLGEVATPTSFTLENQDTAGTNAEYINNSIASGTLANGLTIENTAGGTMTNAINILETAGAITTGINIGNNVGTGISIGTGVTTGISVGSGGITIAAGALAVNSDSITSDGATLTINATGTVDVQDILNADSITSDAGVSIAAAGSYTGAGAVTLSSGGSAGLTINSASNTTTIDSSDTALTASGVTTLTLGAGVTITNASGNINLQPAGSGTTANVQIGAGSSGSNNPDLLGLDVKDNAGDPTGFEGAMYYNNNTNKFRCYQDTAWTDCIGSGGSVDLSSFGSANIAIDDTVPFTDVSNSNTNSKDTLESSQWEQRKRLPNRGFNFYTDFINETSTTATDNGLSETNSTGSTAQQAVNGTGRVGIARSTTSTSASGRAALSSGLSAVAFNGGSWFYETNVNVTTLSTSTERFQLLVGFRDTLTAANQVDGVYFLYDEGGVSTGSTAAAYWQTVTTSNSTRTFNTSLTQTTVTAGSWVRLGIEINAAGTSATFYINGTAVATHTTNIPTGTSRATGLGTLLIKSVGTTARTVDFDYINVVSDWTSAR